MLNHQSSSVQPRAREQHALRNLVKEGCNYMTASRPTVPPRFTFKHGRNCWLFCPYSLFLLPSAYFSCFVEIQTSRGDPDTDQMPRYIMLASSDCVACLGVWDQTFLCPPFVCQELEATVWHWATEYAPLAYSLWTFYHLDLICGEGKHGANCLTFTAFWLTFTRHWRVQTEGDGYRNATRHQHFCQYGSGRNFRASSSGRCEAKVRRDL